MPSTSQTHGGGEPPGGLVEPVRKAGVPGAVGEIRRELAHPAVKRVVALLGTGMDEDEMVLGRRGPHRVDAEVGSRDTALVRGGDRLAFARLGQRAPLTVTVGATLPVAAAGAEVGAR